MTIKDIAAKTGYAVGTVSRALNNHPNVSPKARAAIQQAAAEMGFEMNVNAKQLKQTHSNTILMVVKGTRNELFGEMVEKIQQLISETRYQLVVDYMDEDANEAARAIKLCREKKPLGILFLGGVNENFTEDFRTVDVPCVVATNDASQLPFPNLSSVTIDDREAGRQAVETLISLGHRHIAIVGGDRQLSDTSRLRYEGCLQAIRAHGLDFDPERDYQGVRYSYRDGYRATQALLSAGASGIFLSLFFAYAWMWPEQQVLLFFILPIKMKWMGIAAAAMWVLEFLTGNFASRVSLLFGIAGFLAFFGGEMFTTAKDAIVSYKRRKDWEKKINRK